MAELRLFMPNKHLKTLAVADALTRRERLQQILEEEQLPFLIQKEEPRHNMPLGIINYLIEPLSDAPSILLSAHYDSYPGSLGANDNMSSVCILIALAKTLRALNINARFAFFDGEEKKQAGSRLYASLIDPKTITGAINLDMCGFGDSIVLTHKGKWKKVGIPSLHNKAYFKSANATILNYLPASDNIILQKFFPTINLAIVPYWDIQYLKTLATYGEGLFGRPPEYDMIFEQMEITTTMHGGYRDKIEYVNPEAMDKIYQFLLTALTSC